MGTNARTRIASANVGRLDRNLSNPANTSSERESAGDAFSRWRSSGMDNWSSPFSDNLNSENEPSPSVRLESRLSSISHSAQRQEICRDTAALPSRPAEG